jgi:mRNA interferase MazF
VNVPQQGEIWWAEAEDKRRPYLIVTRSTAIPVLTKVVAAPVSRTMRGIPTEIALGPSEGLRVECAASFDNLEPILRSTLTERAGALGPRRNEICETLRALADC